MKKLMMCATAAMLVLGAAADPVLLNGYAVTGEAGSLDNPLGVASGATIGLAKLFDDDSSTYYEKTSYPCWAGLKFTEPCVVTSVKFKGRTSWWQRMRGILIQGANTADFSDAQTLIVCIPDPSWTSGEYTQFALVPAATNAYTYVRLWCNGSTRNGSCGGNCTDLKFYGHLAAAAPAAPASAPVVSLSATMNGSATFRLSNATDSASVVEVQRKYAGEADWTACETSATGPADVTVGGIESRAATYRLRYVNVSGASAWTEVGAAATYPLFGTWLPDHDTTGSKFVGESNAHDDLVGAHFYGQNAFDGTFGGIFEQKATGGPWSTGLDFGRVREITTIRYLPRLDAHLANAAKCAFQVAGRDDFSASVTVAETPSSGIEARLYEITLDSPVRARYVRVVAKSAADIAFAEVEFGGSSAAPTALTVVPSDVETQNAVLGWTTADTSVGVVVQRATAPGGPWTQVASLVAGSEAWTDTSCVVGVKYWYRVAHAGSSVASETVAYRRAARLERDWSNLTQLRSGCSIIQEGGNATTTYKLFDGDTSTFPDTRAALDKLGVDLGGEYGLAYVRAFPRSDWNATIRLNNVIMYGSNEAEWYDHGEPASPAFVCTKQSQ